MLLCVKCQLICGSSAGLKAFVCAVCRASWSSDWAAWQCCPCQVHWHWSNVAHQPRRALSRGTPYTLCSTSWHIFACFKKGKDSPYSITKRRVPELIPVLGSQLAGDVSHKPGGRLPLLSIRPAVTLATLKRATANFAALWTEARWVWTVCLRLLPDCVAAAIWTQALLRLSLAC